MKWIGIYFVFLFVVFACKVRRQENVGSSNAVDTVINSDKTPDIGIHLFEEGERIYTTDPNFFEDLAKTYQSQNPPPPGATFDNTAFIYATQIQIENLAAENLQNSLNPKSMGLTNLVGVSDLLRWDLKTQMIVKKGVARKLEDLRIAWYTIKSKIDLHILGKGTGDFKSDYFKGAVEKKWNTKELDKFNQMPQFITKRFRDKNGNMITLSEEDLKGFDNVYLGMLPNPTMLKELRDGMGGGNFNIISVVEDFELQHLAKESNLNVQYTGNFQGRYLIDIDVKPGVTESLGVENWIQYSTPDRNMMKGGLTGDAIDRLLEFMKDGKNVYVHCKSGQGRSASVVVGARVAYIMEVLEGKSVNLDKKLIDQLLDEQISHVRLARSVVNISPLQKLNLQKVLYQKAGLF